MNERTRARKCSHSVKHELPTKRVISSSFLQSLYVFHISNFVIKLKESCLRNRQVIINSRYQRIQCNKRTFGKTASKLETLANCILDIKRIAIKCGCADFAWFITPFKWGTFLWKKESMQHWKWIVKSESRFAW